MHNNVSRLLLGMLFVFIEAAPSLQAADVQSIWTGPLYGSWQEPTNWVHAPPLPGADYPHNDLLTYDVEFTNGYAVVPPSLPFAIGTLTMNGGTLHSDYGPITLNGPLLWTNGWFWGGGTFLASNEVIVSGPGDKRMQNLLKTYGPFTVSAPTFRFAAEIYGGLDLQGDGDYFASFSAYSPVRKIGGTGTNRFDGIVASYQALEVHTGTVESVTHSAISGRVLIQSNATLAFAGFCLFPSSSNLVVTGGGQLRLSASPLLISGPVNISTPFEINASSFTLHWSWTMESNTVGTIRNSGINGSAGLLVNEGCLLTLDRTYLDRCRVTNNGTVVFRGEPPLGNGYGMFENNHLVELEDTALVDDGDSLQDYFENRGILRKSTGTNTAVFTGYKLNNRGIVEVSAGKLSLGGRGTNSGVYQVASGATIDFRPDGNPLFTEGVVFNGAGTNRVIGSLCRVSGNVTNLGNFEVWFDGLRNQPSLPRGIFHNASNATMTLGAGGYSQIGCLVRNEGTLTVLYSTGFSPGGAIENRGSASFADGDIWGGPITNLNYLRKHTAGTVSIHSTGSSSGLPGLHNHGLCEVDAGTLVLESYGTSSGKFLVASNALLLILYQTNTLTEGSLLAGGGTITVRGGALAIAGNVTNQTTLSLTSGGGLYGSGRLRIDGPGQLMWEQGQMIGSGMVEIGPTAKMQLEGNTSRSWVGYTINNYGLTSVSGGSTYCHDGVINNYGSFVFTNGGWMNWDSINRRPILNNFATLIVNSPWSGFQGDITNSGAFQIQNGRLDVNRFVNTGDLRVMGSLNAAFVEHRAGTLTATGGIGAVFTNNSILEVGPGFGGLNVSEINLTPESVVNIEIGGTNARVNYDQLASSGEFRFNGTLNLRLTNGFQPVVGQVFSVLSYSHATGFFSRVRGLNLGNGLRLMPVQNYNAMDFVVVPALSATNGPLSMRRYSKQFWRDFVIAWPAGFGGYYFQTATNISGPWQTLYWTYPNAGDTSIFAGDSAPPQFYWRLFDPDSQ